MNGTPVFTPDEGKVTSLTVPNQQSMSLESNESGPLQIVLNVFENKQGLISGRGWDFASSYGCLGASVNTTDYKTGGCILSVKERTAGCGRSNMHGPCPGNVWGGGAKRFSELIFKLALLYSSSAKSQTLLTNMEFIRHHDIKLEIYK